MRVPPLGLEGATLPVRTGWAPPLHWDWMEVPPIRTGRGTPPPHPRIGWYLHRLCRGRYASCCFPQEDCLVLTNNLFILLHKKFLNNHNNYQQLPLDPSYKQFGYKGHSIINVQVSSTKEIFATVYRTKINLFANTSGIQCTDQVVENVKRMKFSFHQYRQSEHIFVREQPFIWVENRIV